MSGITSRGVPTRKDDAPRTAATYDHIAILAGLPQMLTVTDVSRLLGTSEQVVRYLLRTQQIPGRRIGRRWYVPRARLDAFLSSDESVERS
jgi:excisionase family DNA binding protein